MNWHDIRVLVESDTMDPNETSRSDPFYLDEGVTSGVENQNENQTTENQNPFLHQNQNGLGIGKDILNIMTDAFRGVIGGAPIPDGAQSCDGVGSPCVWKCMRCDARNTAMQCFQCRSSRDGPALTSDDVGRSIVLWQPERSKHMQMTLGKEFIISRGPKDEIPKDLMGKALKVL